MTENTDTLLGLRERKRRETRLRIEDCGTELILERGFDQVTLEEICEKAGVSRRTFFNYFDSKDQVASGTGLPSLQPKDVETFAITDSDNVVRDILKFLGDRIDNDPDTSLALSPDRETSLRIKARRRAITAQTPHLMIAGMHRFDALAGAIQEAIDHHLTTFPERRRALTLSAYEEAAMLTSVIRLCLLTSPLLNRDANLSKSETLHRAGKELTGLAAAYSRGWG